MKTLIDELCGLLEKGEDIVVATIVDSLGSTPRSSGAKMVVRRSGRILGTVGGGLVEAAACADAARMLENLPGKGGNRASGAALVRDMNLTQEIAAGTDMICGGKLRLLLETVPVGSAAAKAYLALRGQMRLGRRCQLLTAFGDGEDCRVLMHAVAEDGCSLPAGFPELDGLIARAFESGAPQLAPSPLGGLVLAEPFVPAAPLYLFGGGHVSQATARIAATVGFRIVVVDDRDDFANAERFPWADAVVVAGSLERAMEALGSELAVEDDAFIAILTRGHMHDKTVLAQSLRTSARYIGMIGSRRKRDQVYEALRAEGFGDADFARCHCPIGLTIGGRTPEEIALSIVGEMVAVRAGVSA